MLLKKNGSDGIRNGKQEVVNCPPCSLQEMAVSVVLQREALLAQLVPVDPSVDPSESVRSE